MHTAAYIHRFMRMYIPTASSGAIFSLNGFRLIFSLS